MPRPHPQHPSAELHNLNKQIAKTPAPSIGTVLNCSECGKLLQLCPMFVWCRHCPGCGRQFQISYR